MRTIHRTITAIALAALAIGCKKKIDTDKAEKVIGEKLAELGLASVTWEVKPVRGGD
jgi:hypothetical protein